MTHNPTYQEFPAPWDYIERKQNEKKVVEVYYAVADSHGAALYAATVEGRRLGMSDSEINKLITG